MSDSTRIILTGISGAHISEFADKCVVAGNKEGRAHWVHIRFREILKLVDPEANKFTDLEWSDSFLKRGAAFRHIATAAMKLLIETIGEQETNAGSLGKKLVIIVSIHISLRRGKILAPGLNVGVLGELEPDFFITVVRDALDIWKELKARPQERWKNIGPLDVLEWREFETFITGQLAEFSGDQEGPKPFFILPFSQQPEILTELLGEKRKKRYYRSYPITFVKDHPDVHKEANLIGDEINAVAISFNPMGITDYDRLDEFKDEYKKWCTEKGHAESDLYWDEILEHISQHTVTRDHRLIDQSDGIVVFYPELPFFFEKDGKKIQRMITPFSSGVLDEMHYATQRGKKVILIWPERKDEKGGKRTAGPFMAEIYSHKLASREELRKLLQSEE